MTESEVWKDIVDYEGYYQVSNKGNVRSIGRKDSIGRKRRGLTLKLRNTRKGYILVDLSKNGIRETKYTHRLVAEAFLPNPNNYPEVNHRDEVKDNNNVENLEWCDTRYNLNYGTARKRAAKKTSNKVKAVNVVTGEVLTFNSTQESGRKGYDQASVSAACRGVYKWGSTGKLIGDGRTYKGYKWYYEEGE